MKKFIVTILLVSAFTCGCTQSQISNEGTISNANIQRTNQEQDLTSNQQQTPETKEELHPIDKAERDCISDKFSTYDLSQCSYKAMNSWFKEIDNYLRKLKDITTEEDYSKILRAQEDWKKYQQTEFEAVSLIMEKQGTMFQNSAVGVKTNVVKERALELERLYKILTY